MINVEQLAVMGDDLMVVNAARVSFRKWRTEFLPSDTRLIAYLAREGHWSPFAHPQMQFRVEAPVFVARQLAKHVVGLVWNEVSRRYVDDAPEFYQPAVWRERSEDKKQGSGGPSPMSRGAADLHRKVMDEALGVYHCLVGHGIAPEQARMVLPQSMMTSWIWTGSLFAFARVCRERLHPHAQAETREVAEAIARHMAKAFPTSWAALAPAHIDEGALA